MEKPFRKWRLHYANIIIPYCRLPGNRRIRKTAFTRYDKGLPYRPPAVFGLYGRQWANKDVLNQYIKHLNQHFAPRSAKRKLASIRAFYHEMEMCGKLEENPFDKLHIRIHSPQQLPRVIPEQVVQSLLQSAYNAYAPGCREVLRDIVVLELLFSTGLRVSELCALSKDTFC